MTYHIQQGLQDGMKMRKLPGSDLLVSELCLGTMTFGEQNTKEQSFLQLDMATKEYGINFLVSNHLFLENSYYFGHTIQSLSTSRLCLTVTTISRNL